MVADGTSFKSVSVLSGVYQGTVVGHLMFYCTSDNISDINDWVFPHFVYLLMIVLVLSNHIPHDSMSLQKDLDLLSHWAEFKMADEI